MWRNPSILHCSAHLLLLLRGSPRPWETVVYPIIRSFFQLVSAHQCADCRSPGQQQEETLRRVLSAQVLLPGLSPEHRARARCSSPGMNCGTPGSGAGRVYPGRLAGMQGGRDGIPPCPALLCASPPLPGSRSAPHRCALYKLYNILKARRCGAIPAALRE